MIKTESLKFSYDGKKYFDFPDINLDSGENLLIIGKLWNWKKLHFFIY